MTNKQLEGIFNRKKLEAAGMAAYKALWVLKYPFLGIPLAVWESYQNSRITELLKELDSKMELLEFSKVDKEHIKSEEFLDLIQKALRIRMQHRSKAKAQLIVSLITESMRIDRDMRFSTDIKETFLLMLEGMSDKELIFLSDFAHDKYKGKKRGDIYQSGDHQAMAMDALYAKGILKDEDTWQKYITVSMLGREFIEYVKILGS